MHAVIFGDISFTDFFDAASRCHNDAECLVMTLCSILQGSALADLRYGGRL